MLHVVVCEAWRQLRCRRHHWRLVLGVIPDTKLLALQLAQLQPLDLATGVRGRQALIAVRPQGPSRAAGQPHMNAHVPKCLHAMAVMKVKWATVLRVLLRLQRHTLPLLQPAAKTREQASAGPNHTKQVQLGRILFEIVANGRDGLVNGEK